MSTGIVLGKFDDDTEYERIARWQFDGGLEGFKDWYRVNRYYYYDGWEFHIDTGILEPLDSDVIIVCEKFVPLPAPRSFKLNELEPIRIEGALASFHENIVWQRSSAMVLTGGESTAERKKNSDDVLRGMGLWTTGKDVGMKDANDVNSAQKHAIAYLRSIGHAPTLAALAEQ
jgi:hypothetical protein